MKKFQNVEGVALKFMKTNNKNEKTLQESDSSKMQAEERKCRDESKE